MLFPSDTHQPPSPPHPHPAQRASSDTPHSDSGRSLSSSSSSEIMGTPFDLGAQRFEYPFPPVQGSPTDAFLPLSSSITSHSHSHSHAQLPPWPIHISKSFPLTPPPLGKFKAHPKLRSANAREPPVPPGLAKRKSRIAGLTHQSSSEEPSDKSDNTAPARRLSRPPHTLTDASSRKPPQPDVPTSSIFPMKYSALFPIRLFDRPAVEDSQGLAVNDASPPRPTVLQRERKAVRVRDHIYLFTFCCCWIVASQLSRWFFRFLGWFSRA